MLRMPSGSGQVLAQGPAVTGTSPAADVPVVDDLAHDVGDRLVHRAGLAPVEEVRGALGDTVGHLVADHVVGGRVAGAVVHLRCRSRTRSRRGRRAGEAEAHGLGQRLACRRRCHDRSGRSGRRRRRRRSCRRPRRRGRRRVSTSATPLAAPPSVTRWADRGDAGQRVGERRAPRRRWLLSQTMRFLASLMRSLFMSTAPVWSSTRTIRRSSAPRVSSNRHAVRVGVRVERADQRWVDDPAAHRTRPWPSHPCPAAAGRTPAPSRWRRPARPSRSGPSVVRRGLGQDRVQLAVRAQADDELAAHDREAADVLLVADDVTGDGGGGPQLGQRGAGAACCRTPRRTARGGRRPRRRRWSTTRRRGRRRVTPAGTPTKS